MKKLKSLACIGLFSILLVGNVFATTTITGSVSSFFESVMTYVSGFTSDEDCPLRICQTCKPGTDCRPTPN